MKKMGVFSLSDSREQEVEGKLELGSKRDKRIEEEGRERKRKQRRSKGKKKEKETSKQTELNENTKIYH